MGIAGRWQIPLIWQNLPARHIWTHPPCSLNESLIDEGDTSVDDIDEDAEHVGDIGDVDHNIIAQPADQEQETQEEMIEKFKKKVVQKTVAIEKKTGRYILCLPFSRPSRK